MFNVILLEIEQKIANGGYFKLSDDFADSWGELWTQYIDYFLLFVSFELEQINHLNNQLTTPILINF